MERAMSVEDKIKRAEEIYNKRRENHSRINTATVSVNSKKDLKLFRKMIIQIIICLAIYCGFYLVKNNNYIFSEDLINQTKQVLSYDVNFSEIYYKCLESLRAIGINVQPEDKVETTEETKGIEANGIGGAEEINKEESAEESVTTENTSALTQMDQDAINIKNSISFINPISGTITSTFGWRNPTTDTVPKYHTGLDIGATRGTVICSATDGEVVLASFEGDYGNHLKIQINDVVIIYAHCKVLYVKQGDHITQGQQIAEVGSTGNSTGPHLHLEIRKEDRLVDPQLILNI